MARIPFYLIAMAALLAIVADAAETPARNLVRVAAAQAKSRVIGFKLNPAEALAAVDRNLAELQTIVERAGEAKCDVLCLPEDTLGLLNWIGVNETHLKEVLPAANRKLLENLGGAAAKHRMHLVVCSDHIEDDGHLYNTAFFLGRDGREIGRYHKVCPTLAESSQRRRGTGFPVFPTSDLGTVGMLICYDLVFPETARALALQGADIIFFPTMGGAAMADRELAEQALRVRAVENFTWLVVAHRGNGAMIISPQGKIVARAEGPDGLAISEIDIRGSREGGDAMNWQKDMRARLFRERNPEAFAVLTNPQAPVLEKVPLTLTAAEAGRISARVLTLGEEEFKAASSLASSGDHDGAFTAFSRLKHEYRDSWIDRESTKRLAQLESTIQKKPGLAAKYPGDKGIEKDPAVIFVEAFDVREISELKKRWDTVTQPEIMSLVSDVPAGSSGKQSLLMTHIGGQGTGGHLYRRLQPGHDKIFARFYVKFDPDCAEIHHFGTSIGGNNPPTPWPMVSAGKRTDGNKSFWTGIEPFGKNWRWDYYAYWQEMRGSPPRGQTWGNSFVQRQDLKVTRGQWQCIEVMMKVNDVGDSNGELALWIDGKAVSHLGKGFPRGKWLFDKFMPGQGGDSARWNDAKGDRENFQTAAGGEPFEGFRWRTAKDLNVNFLWTYLYITGAPAGHVSKVWFDQIVVATEYIGLIKAGD